MKALYVAATVLLLAGSLIVLRRQAAGRVIEAEAALAAPTFAELTPTSDMEAILFTAADEFGVDRALALAMMTQESGGSPTAVSYAGATGLMQIMPATGAGIARDLGLSSYDLNDPQTNARFGAYYISQKLKRYGSVEWALAAYNWGPASVDGFLSQHPEALAMDWPTIIATWGSEIPAETQGYVTNIIAMMIQAQTEVEAIVPPAPVSGYEVVAGMQINASFDTTNCTYWGNQPGCQHLGTDIGGADGDGVYAPFGGTYKMTGAYAPGDPSCPRCLGEYVIYTLPDGSEMYFGHLRNAVRLQPGTAIHAGDQIGEIRGDLAHTHWQCRDAGGALFDCMMLFQ